MSEVQIFPQTEITLTTIPHQSDYYSRLQALTQKSTESILVCQYVFSISDTRHWQRSNKILDSILEAHARGIEIKVLFDRPMIRKPNAKANIKTFFQLAKAGIDVRCLTILKTLHIKLLIFDRTIFLAGSHNLTDSSLYSPFELTFECWDPFLTNSAVTYFNCLFNGSMSQPFDEALKQEGYANQ